MQLRAYFEAQGFIEAETPMLVPATSLEPHIDPIHASVSLQQDAPAETRFLHTSPELALKRVLAQTSLKKIYQISKVFRDGECGPMHRPEFTLLEWYRVDAPLETLMADCEAIMRELASALELHLPAIQKPFERHSLATLFETYAHIDLMDVLRRMNEGESNALVTDAQKQGLVLRPGADFEDAFFHIMGTRIETAVGLTAPAFITGWPAQMAVLAERDPREPLLASRFELYFHGLELANAFHELRDPKEQRQRFESDNRKRVTMGKSPLPMDDDFLEDLNHLPNCSGIAMGMDRLLMALYQTHQIKDVAGLAWR